MSGKDIILVQAFAHSLALICVPDFFLHATAGMLGTVNYGKRTGSQ